ncbi:hypothetical protein [Paraburkholderia lacunae]|uniref:hypothetical protein n=1 Tax=Paraburkholderia lacunae TaxID=2211104 RepID=UPI0014035A4F|nr:hypothetical protein [Paraburkholderia lacunae]
MSDQDNPLLKYHEAEMRYLRNASSEFAAQPARRFHLETIAQFIESCPRSPFCRRPLQ